MTIVCCWFDRSFGRSRITAVADARAAYKRANSWLPLAETTVKLFKADIKCHAIVDLDPLTGVWKQPFYRTEIGIGFAGFCFEGLSIIALLSRCLEQLVIDGEDRPAPGPGGIINFAKEIIARYFKDHSVPAQQTVEFIIFGFGPETGEPWVGIITHNSRDGVSAVVHDPIREDRVYLLGDAAICRDLQPGADEIIGRIRSHAASLAPGNGEDAVFDQARERARHHDAQKKILEDLVLSKFPKHATVGGVLQKIELFRQGGAAVAAFTRDDRPYILHRLPVLHPAGLGYVPIDEVMGQKPRE